MGTSLEQGSLVTVGEAAALLRLRPSTIRAWLTQGRIRRVKLGRRTVLRREDLEQLVVEGLERGESAQERATVSEPVRPR